jgi:heme exporter protein A
MSERLLRLDRVSKHYGRHRALIDVSLEFRPGRVAALLGPNGAGKSTLLGLLSTLSHPTSGEITFDGQPLHRSSPLRAQIGYVGHEPGVYGDLPARENLRVFASLYGLREAGPRIEAMLARVGLADVRREAPARTFSRGMLQRLALARALLHEPEILLLDEPFTGLDPQATRWLTTTIAELHRGGTTILMVTHDPARGLSLTDRWILLSRGRLTASGDSAATSREMLEERLSAVGTVPGVAP